MKTITLQLFTFDELDEKAQEAVLDKLRHVNVDDDYWYEATYSEWKEQLAKRGFEDAEIRFSGFSSQGDGASFTCKSVDALKWAKALKIKLSRAMQKAFKEGELTANVSRNGFGSYVHDMTICADIEGEAEGVDGNEYAPLADAMTEDARTLSRLLYRALENDYEYRTSDDAVKECIEANEWTFEKNGTMRNA